MKSLHNLLFLIQNEATIFGAIYIKIFYIWRKEIKTKIKCGVMPHFLD
jgi:hypothetical protein